jgi:hypothetical protein
VHTFRLSSRDKYGGQTRRIGVLRRESTHQLIGHPESVLLRRVSQAVQYDDNELRERLAWWDEGGLW